MVPNPGALAVAALVFLSGPAAAQFREAQVSAEAVLDSPPRTALLGRSRGRAQPVAQNGAPRSWPEAIEAAERATVFIDAQETTGSGFIIDPSGLVITNSHVTGEEIGSAVKVTLGGVQHEAKLLAAGAPKCRDLALLALDPKKGPWPSLRFSDAPPRKGQEVVALGFPSGPVGKNGEATVTANRGIVSGLDRRHPHHECFLYTQTDAAINAGNSGGPLLGADGRVVGVNTWQFDGKQLLNFAIRVSDVTRSLAQYRRVGHLSEGSLSLFIHRDPRQGIEVRQVLPGRGAAKAGVFYGDVITAYDGIAAGDDGDSAERFVRYLRELVPGDAITLTLRRGGSTFRVTVPIEKLAPIPSQRQAGAVVFNG